MPEQPFAALRRTWFAKMSSSAAELLAGVVPPDLAPALVELAPYFADSFGNATRIDYGTGHETTFCALLCCLAKLGVLKETDLLVRAGGTVPQTARTRCASWTEQT